MVSSIIQFPETGILFPNPNSKFSSYSFESLIICVE